MSYIDSLDICRISCKRDILLAKRHGHVRLGILNQIALIIPSVENGKGDTIFLFSMEVFASLSRTSRFATSRNLKHIVPRYIVLPVYQASFIGAPTLGISGTLMIEELKWMALTKLLSWLQRHFFS